MCAVAVTLVSPGVAAAQDMPTATTGTPRDVTHHAATLVASVQPGASSLNVSFVFGRGGTLEQVSETRQVAAGSGQTEVAIPVTGFSPSSVYEVQVVAEDDAFVVVGQKVSFRTGSPPRAPEAETYPVAKSSATTATLAGTVRTNGQATTYHFEYGPTPGLGTATPARQVPGGVGPAGSHIVNAALSGLPPAATTYFQLVVSSIGGTGRSDVKAFTTPALAQALALDIGPPSVVYGRPLAIGGRVLGVGDLTGLPVVVEGLIGPAWQRVASATVTAAGTWTARLASVRAPIPLRAWIGDVPDRATSAVRTPAVRPAVGLAVTRARRKGPLMTVTVRPALKGMVVAIQRRARNGRWTRVARRVVTNDAATGVFRLRAPSRTGTHRAVVTPKTTGWVQATAR